MGHCIQAVIGMHETIQKLAEDWVCAEEIRLPQGYGMVLLTNALLDDLTELFDVPDEFCCPELDFFTVAAERFLQQYSFQAKLAYIETDYFGGVGTQAGVLYENGRILIGPRSGDGTINLLLKEFGVWCESDKDAFDSLTLGRYRHMPG